MSLAVFSKEVVGLCCGLVVWNLGALDWILGSSSAEDLSPEADDTPFIAGHHGPTELQNCQLTESP